jgi:hypothetical protein
MIRDIIKEVLCDAEFYEAKNCMVQYAVSCGENKSYVMYYSVNKVPMMLYSTQSTSLVMQGLKSPVNYSTL